MFAIYLLCFSLAWKVKNQLIYDAHENQPTKKFKMDLIMQHKKRERETRLTYAFSWHLKFIDAINVKIAGIIIYATDN